MTDDEAEYQRQSDAIDAKRKAFIPPVVSAAPPKLEPFRPDAESRVTGVDEKGLPILAPAPPSPYDDVDNKRGRLQFNLGIGGSRSGTEHEQPSLGSTGTSPFARGDDVIAPNLRQAITPDNRNYTRGNVLPLARNNQTGRLEVAIPQGAYDFANGLLDLAEGPITGTVSPAGTNALLTAGGLMRSPFSPGRFSAPRVPSAIPEDVQRMRAYQLWEQAGRPEGRDQEFWAAAGQPPPAPPAGPPPPSAFSQAMHNRLATALGHAAGSAAGAWLGSDIGGGLGLMAGATIGYPTGDLVRELAARYGPMVTGKMLSQMGVTNWQNLLRNAFTLEPQNQRDTSTTPDTQVLPFGGPGQGTSPSFNGLGKQQNQLLLPQYAPSA